MILTVNMKRYFLLLVLLLPLLFASCDEMFTVVPDGITEPTFMQLSRDNIIIMEGDSVLLETAFQPADIYNNSVYWMSDNPEIASVRKGMLTGVSMGKTNIYAISVSEELIDTCLVEVFPHWAISPYDYQYDMPVYADVTIDGERLNDRMVVGAFCGDELRGAGVMQESNGIRYLAIRTYSNKPSGERISFRCYHRDSICFVDLNEAVVFGHSKPVGSLSNLFQLTGHYPAVEIVR